MNEVKSKAKHTPGPWHWNDGRPYRGSLKIEGEFRICTMTGNNTEANARLIAAAPTLESVARLALQITQVNLQDPMQLILLNVQMANLAALAKIALDQVEGREHDPR